MKVQGADTKGTLPRAEAWRMINAVIRDQRPVSELTLGKTHMDLAPQHRAAALRLTIKALRFADRSDWLLKPFLRKEPHVEIRNLLRLCLAETFAFGAPPHAVVDAGVALAKGGQKTGRAAGFVNATLRRAIDHGTGRWDKGPVPKLPKWIRNRLLKIYGNQTLTRMEKAHMGDPPLDLTLKPGAGGLAGDLAGDLAQDWADHTLPNGSIRFAEFGQVSAIAGFDTGDWWVQDAAASMAVALSGVTSGDTALDLCAAPGGKTLQLAAAGAKVTAVDDAPARLARLSENLTRTGLAADVICADVLTHTTGHHDLVLLDPPCSATGTIRRHPDLPYIRGDGDIAPLVALQKKMLRRAAGWVRPGGQLVFCTCSLLPEEGEEQAVGFLKKHPGFCVMPITAPWVEQDWITPEGGLRLRPDYWADQGGMDGFYIIVMKNQTL